MIAGGVAGALIGSQIGQGRGTTVAEVAGAAVGPTPATKSKRG